MKTKSLFIPLLILITKFQILSQNRIFYVDNFNSILNSYHQQTELLKYCKSHNFNALILYDLDKINKSTPLANKNSNQNLANFISRAKNEFGIKEIAASGENGSFFINVIHKYNQSRKADDEKFDVYNLEYEYWKEKDSAPKGYYCEEYLKPNGIPCNRQGSFAYFIESLNIMKLLANEPKFKVKTEVYVGTFDDKETQKLVQYIDRVLIHAYVKSPKQAYHFTKNRLNYIAKLNKNVSVSILFSAEMNFMGDYLSKYTAENAEKDFFNELLKDDATLKNKITFDGFTYYTYFYFKKAHAQLDYIQHQKR